jgi:hypothetical protein
MICVAVIVLLAVVATVVLTTLAITWFAFNRGVTLNQSTSHMGHELENWQQQRGSVNVNQGRSSGLYGRALANSGVDGSG